MSSGEAIASGGSRSEIDADQQLEQDCMVMYIATVLGGPEMTGTAVDRLIGKITDLRGDVPVRDPPSDGPIADSGSLEIVFEVAGSIFAPDYQGVRTASLSRKRRLLQVQIAVPRAIQAKDEAEIRRFTLESLREAVRVAAPAFQRAKIPYRSEEYEQLIDRIERSLSPN